MTENPNYYAVIPANVRYSDITPNAKLLYGEITALANKTGYCYANNSYFSNLYNVSEVSISKWISELVKKGFINRQLNYKEGTKEILNRYLRIVNYPIKENLSTLPKKSLIPSQRKVNDPIKEKFKDNNTDLIIHNNNTINKDYQLAVDFWLKDFKQGWTFTGMHGKALKQILTKLTTISKGMEQDIYSLFVYFCTHLPEWYKDKDLPLLNSKFNEIITEIKNNKNGKNDKKSKFNT
jgi:hypothetical protein